MVEKKKKIKYKYIIIKKIKKSKEEKIYLFIILHAIFLINFYLFLIIINFLYYFN